MRGGGNPQNSTSTRKTSKPYGNLRGRAHGKKSHTDAIIPIVLRDGEKGVSSDSHDKEQGVEKEDKKREGTITSRWL